MIPVPTSHSQGGKNEINITIDEVNATTDGTE